MFKIILSLIISFDVFMTSVCLNSFFEFGKITDAIGALIFGALAVYKLRSSIWGDE